MENNPGSKTESVVMREKILNFVIKQFHYSCAFLLVTVMWVFLYIFFFPFKDLKSMNLVCYKRVNLGWSPQCFANLGVVGFFTLSGSTLAYVKSTCSLFPSWKGTVDINV